MTPKPDVLARIEALRCSGIPLAKWLPNGQAGHLTDDDYQFLANRLAAATSAREPTVEHGHNHTTEGLPTYPVCREACPLGCDQPLPPTEQIEVTPGRFLPRPRMFVLDPIAEGVAGMAVAARLAAAPADGEETE